MTLVHFNYTDSYNKPSRGSLAFTPHRRHAANETEILPKPVTVPLLNGELTVDLQPNPSTWVWIITEYFDQHSESMYTTIPDSDGVIEAVDLISINPSTIPAPYNAVEPVWWAEMRQYKQTVTETLLKAGEALENSESSLEEGAQNRDESRQSAANAKAYYEQSRDSAYESKEYRDQSEEAAVEAERQADRAASGPESAAGRAETARDESEQYRDETRTFRDAAQSSANDARDDAQSANQHSSNAYNSARDADTAQETAETYRDEARVARDELLAEPDALMDLAQDAKDTTAEYRDTAKQHADTAESTKNTVATVADEVQQYRNDAQLYASDAESYLGEFRSERGYAIFTHSSQDLPAGVATDVVFENARVHGDIGEVIDGKLIVSKPGVYSISGNIRLNTPVSSNIAQVRVSAGDEVVESTGSSSGHSASIAAVELNEGDEIKLIAYTSDDDALIRSATRTTSLRIAYLQPLME